VAINFPTSLDNFTNPVSGNTLDSPSHSLQHSDINDAVEALEAKLGIGASPAGSATSGQVLTAGTAGTSAWTTLATGKILQIVRATDGTARTTTSTSSVDANISVTISPTKSTSNVLIIWAFRATHYNTSDFALFSITDNSNNNIAGAEFGVLGSNTTTRIDSSLVLIGYASPGTTSATTYKGRFRVETNGTTELRNNLQTGQLFAIEVGI
jgi:hypothetical protein